MYRLRFFFFIWTVLNVSDPSREKDLIGAPR